MNKEFDFKIQIEGETEDEILTKFVAAVGSAVRYMQDQGRIPAKGLNIRDRSQGVAARLEIQKTQSYIDAIERNLYKELEKVQAAIANYGQQTPALTNPPQRSLIDLQNIEKDIKLMIDGILTGEEGEPVIRMYDLPQGTVYPGSANLGEI